MQWTPVSKAVLKVEMFCFDAFVLVVRKQNVKVAEHSFQEPMPNSPLLLSYLCKVNHKELRLVKNKA